MPSLLHDVVLPPLSVDQPLPCHIETMIGWLVQGPELELGFQIDGIAGSGAKLSFESSASAP
ncbi:MAG: hypothetical protein AB7O71_01095 [Hyphomicrobiaceae bacterium]